MELDLEIVKMFRLEDLRIEVARYRHSTTPAIIFNMTLGVRGIDLKVYIETTAKYLFGRDSKQVMSTTLMARSGGTTPQSFTGPAMEYLLAEAKNISRQVANDILDVQLEV